MPTGQNSDAKNISVILLAAGASSRLGRPKQMLLYHGQTLLQHSLQAAVQSNAHPVIVVLGADAHEIKNTIDHQQTHVVVNEAWEEGMASSIRCGINTLQELDLSAEAAILMVCDQPYISAAIINKLIQTRHHTGKQIIACSYAGTLGPPTLFHKTIFPELLQLKGDVGARSILQKHAHEVEAVLFAQGALDIDTESDYQKLT